jgi:hypothetical protein
LDTVDAVVLAELWDIFEKKIPKDKPEVAVRLVNFLIEQGVEESTLRDLQNEVGDGALADAVDEVLEEYVDSYDDEDDGEY